MTYWKRSIDRENVRGKKKPLGPQASGCQAYPCVCCTQLKAWEFTTVEKSPPNYSVTFHTIFWKG